MRILGIIPARYGSTRFPGKPLAIIRGKTMIRRVFEKASAAPSLNRLIVATDDLRIAEEIEKSGGQAILTDKHHNSGTDRCFEAAKKLTEQYDVVINIQGDEPYIAPGQIEELCDLMSNPEVKIGTLIKPFSDMEEVFNPNKVKVVLDKEARAMYFSRAPLPFVNNPEKFNAIDHFKHVGIYGYRMEVLAEIIRLEPAWPEKAESLEQLRWLYHGYPIHCRETKYESWSIDSPDDIRSLPETDD